MGIKTDNSYFRHKAALRLYCLPQKNDITVLDCYAGEGFLWKEIQQQTKKKITVIGIDIQQKKGNLKGDNLKYLQTLDLLAFDIIDLDAYGIPFQQLEVLFHRQYQGIIFITFIQSLFGCLPLQMLEFLGYPPKMVKQCYALFNQHGFQKFKEYLALRGISKCTEYSLDNKHYLCINSYKC